jgi:outer membrane protein OmpA-like peptidoglycan-associated protein
MPPETVAVLIFKIKKIIMRPINLLLTGVVSFAIVAGGCKSMNKTKKGAIIGTAGGAGLGAIIGRASGNTALGTVIGAAVGGVTGTIIGKKMDKQAEEIKKQVPGAKVERVGEGINVEFTEKILFDFSSSELKPISRQNLDKLGNILTKYPDTDIEVQGHTDSRGTDEYNMGLATRRANVVSTYLSATGISSNRVTVKPFGESVPVASNDTDEGRGQNRRVNFLITANEKMKADARKESGNN